MNNREAERIRRLVALVKLHHPVFNTLVAEWTPRGETVELTIWARVPDRAEPSREITTREPSLVGVKMNTPIHASTLEKMPDHEARSYLAIRLRDALIVAATHEIDEMIMCNGRREFDPHLHDEDRKTRALGA